MRRVAMAGTGWALACLLAARSHETLAACGKPTRAIKRVRRSGDASLLRKAKSPPEWPMRWWRARERAGAEPSETIVSDQAPKSIEFGDSILRTAAGKMDQKELRKRFWGDVQHMVN